MSILYLVHGTSREIRGERLRVSNDLNDQFPGVYFTLITNENRLREQLYPGKTYNIFSKKLLEQHNWHLNVRDMNGIVTETTMFPWNTEQEIVRALKQSSQNELVFHDDVPLTYLVKRIQVPKHIPAYNINKLLPTKVMTNDTKPNYKHVPFYLYCDVSAYTGIPNEFTRASSLRWFRKMAQVARIPTSKTDTRNGIIQKINRVRSHYWTHREEQNLYPLIRCE